MKVFNTTAVCIPDKHYMVDLSERVKEIKKLVDAGKYFTINRARQYGKTTTLNELALVLQNEYLVLNISFEGLTEGGAQTEGEFTQTISRLVMDQHEFYGVEIPDQIVDTLEEYNKREPDKLKLDELYRTFRRWIANINQQVVLIIDEVDKVTNNQVFIDFLGLLRDGFIARESRGIKTFQCVILAGVTDVKHLQGMIRPEGEHKENSPWNIAADFTIDMSLSETGIDGMLKDYEADHHTGMDTANIAKQIREYTNGYPFLVSRLCQLLDEEVSKKLPLTDAWTKTGLDEAVKLILQENNTLFQSLTKNLNNYPDLKMIIRGMLMEGTRIPYSPDQKEIAELQMYGLIRNDHNTVRVANRIFETRLYNLFISEEDLQNNVFYKTGDLEKNRFVEDGKLNMRLILQRFIETYTEVIGPREERFKEKDGRELFLLYLKPIINGTGNYYIESQTRDQTRTDVIVDYLGQQYIIELKIWRGPRYNAEGEKQISEYLDYFGLTTGYMLSFNFNKNKKTGVELVHIGDKLLYEGTV